MQSKLVRAVVPVVVLLLFASPGAVGQEELTHEPPNSKVHQLTYDNFWSFLDRHPLALVEFYAPWCGHCQQLAPNYREAAAILADEDLPTPVVFAKYDDSTDYQRQLRAGAPDMFDYQAYPSLFVFRHRKHERYTGGREADDLVFYMSAVAKGLDPEEEEKKSKPGFYKKEADYNENVLMELYTENFDDVVVQDKNTVWIIEFYSDHCPICKTLAPQIRDAANRVHASLAGKVRMGGVNMRVNSDLGEKWGIKSYPWVAAFYGGEKTEDMRGLSGADSVVRFAEHKNKDHSPSGSPSPRRATSSPTDSPDAAAGGAAQAAQGVASGVVYGGNNAEHDNASWREILGRHTWYLLHAVGATYPEHPSEADKQGVRYLLAALGQLFPCKACRRHLQSTLASKSLGPIDTDSRGALSQWLCKLHNIVNKQTGKPTFDCDPLQLDLMYLRDCTECKEKSEPGEVHKKAVAWSASLYAKDPAEFQALGGNQQEVYEASELNNLLEMAMQYNILSKKKHDQMKRKAEEGEKAAAEVVSTLTVLLRPVLRLKEELRQAKLAARAA